MTDTRASGAYWRRMVGVHQLSPVFLFDDDGNIRDLSLVRASSTVVPEGVVQVDLKSDVLNGLVCIQKSLYATLLAALIFPY